MTTRVSFFSDQHIIFSIMCQKCVSLKGGHGTDAALRTSVSIPKSWLSQLKSKTTYNAANNKKFHPPRCNTYTSLVFSLKPTASRPSLNRRCRCASSASSPINLGPEASFYSIRDWLSKNRLDWWFLNLDCTFILQLEVLFFFPVLTTRPDEYL